MDVELRRALPEDAPSLAAAEVAAWRAAYRGLMPNAYLDGLSEAEKADAWRENLLKHGPTGRKRVTLAEVEASVVGFVRAGVTTEETVDEHEEVGLVYLLYVLPAYWSLGVGRALMAAAMSDLRDLGAREAVLWVLAENQRARRFYERLGWQPDGRSSTQSYGGVSLEARRYRRKIEG